MSTINVSGYSGSVGSLNIVSGALSLNGSAGTAGQYLQSQGNGALPQWGNGNTSNKVEMYTIASDAQSVPAATNYQIPFLHTNYNSIPNLSYGSNTFTNISTSTMILLVTMEIILLNFPAGKVMTLLINQNSNANYQYGTSILENGGGTTTFGNNGTAVLVLTSGDSFEPIVSHTNSSSIGIYVAAITIIQIG